MNRNNKNYAQAAAQSKLHNNNTHHQNQQHHHQLVSQQNQTSGNSTSSNFSSSANGKAINKSQSKPQAQHNSTMGNGNTGRSTSIKQKNPVQLPMNGHAAWEKKTTIEFGSINTPNAQISPSTSTGPALTSGGGLPPTLPTKGVPTFGSLNTTTQTTQATQAIPTTVGTSGPGANNNNSNNNSNNNNNNGVAHKPISARAGEIPRTHSAPPQIQDNNRNVGQSNYLSNVPATRAIHQQQSTVVSHQQPSTSVSNPPLNHRKDSVSSTVSSNDGQPPFHPHHSPHHPNHAHNTHHHYGRHHNHKPNMGPPPNQYRPRDNKNVTHPSPHLNPAQSVSTQGVPMAGPPHTQMWQYGMQMPFYPGYPVHNPMNPMFIPQQYTMQPRPPIQQPHLTQVPTVNYKPPNISTKKSQAIEIIDPNKNAPIQYVKPQLSKSPHKREEAPPVVFDKKPEESDKEKPSSDDKGISRAVPIVDPAERERKEREEQERAAKEKAEQERKEREEKERVAKEKEEQERREREDRERKEREEKERIAKEKEEQERRAREEREERERKEREERERIAKEKAEQERKEREERERIAKEKEEQERRAREEREERERKEREEQERIAKEKAEQERKEQEEKERIAKEKEEQERREREEREKREREERERIAKEEQERKEREEKERIEKEEKERKEAEKARKEQEEKEEIERKKKEEEEAKIKAAAEDDEKKKEKEAESNDSKKEEKKYGKGHRPGPLDLSRTTSAPAIPSAPLSALGSARAIDDINSVQYPEGILSPNPALNSNAEPGKFKYDRSFLMQFMGVCKEKPENLPALEAIGMEEPKDDKRKNRPSVSRSNSSMHKNSPQFPMGEFKFPPKTSEERFAVSNMRNGSPVMFGSRTSLSRTGSGSTLLPAPAMSQTPSSPSRTSSGRGPTRKSGKSHQMQLNVGEQVAPLERSENRWIPGLDPKTTESGLIPIDSVKRKVKALLNKLTLEKFDSISDQIVDYANKSRDEKDGRILREVIRLIFEKSCDESNFCAMYAQLCRKMMERVDPEIVDENVKNTEGKFVQGGTLFRKYLLNRCQEDFEKGWKVNIPVPSNEKGEPDLMSDEYYVAAKAKRQGLGLIRFIGELFKLNMLTERIMHECIKKLLIFQGSPEEEEMESLCKLMNTVGEQLDHVKTNQHEHIKANQIDHAKAKQLMESYFNRMEEISKLPNLSSRIKFMIMDIIDLRSNAWKPRRDINAPKTIAEIHEDAAKQKEEAEFLRRSASSGGKLPKISEQMSRSGSGRRDHKGMTHGSPGNDGWINVGGSSSQRKDKVGDLTKFGSVSRGKITGNNFSLAPGGLPLSGGAKGWKSDNKDRDDKTTVLSRTNSTSNMYSVLTAESSEGRKSSESSTPEVQKPPPPTERKRIILAPRTKAITPEESHSADKPAPKSNSEATSSVQSIPDESIKKINNMMEEYFSVLDIQEVLQCLKEIPAEHHARAIESFANKVLEKKQKDVDNVTKLFKEIVSSGTCDVNTFKSGFRATLDFLMDIGADAPMSYSFTGQLMFSAGLDFRDITKLLTSLDDDKSIEKIVRGYTSALKNDVDEQKYVQKLNEFDFKTLFPKKNKDDINKYLEDLGLGSSKK